jgi:hypothetical protein
MMTADSLMVATKRSLEIKSEDVNGNKGNRVALPPSRFREKGRVTGRW